MNIIYKTFILLLITVPLSLQAAYYRWTDSKGEVHYSSSIPPSDSQLGYEELSKNGMTTKKVSSSKKNRELRLLEIKQAKQRKIDLQKLKRKRIEEAEDSRLLYIFNNEDELSESYNAKLRLAQLTIDLLKSRHKVQSDKLGVLERRLERGSTAQQTEALEKQINNIIDNLKIYQQAITENIVEKDSVKKDYVVTLKRYKRLVAALPQTQSDEK
jgi:hypothetical protein